MMARMKTPTCNQAVWGELTVIMKSDYSSSTPLKLLKYKIKVIWYVDILCHSYDLHSHECRRTSLKMIQHWLVVVRQKGPSKNCWRQLKMRAGLSRNNGGEKRPSDGMRISTVQSRNSGDAGKPVRKVAARRNIRRPSTSPTCCLSGKIPG